MSDADADALLTAGSYTEAAKKFEDLVAAKATELGSKTEAIRFCVKNHASEHSAYESRVRSGEVITL